MKGHNGDEGNEGADAQANMGATLPAVRERNWAVTETIFRERVEMELEEMGKVGGMLEAVPLEVEGETEMIVIDDYPGREPDIEGPAKVRKLAHIPSKGP